MEILFLTIAGFLGQKFIFLSSPDLIILAIIQYNNISRNAKNRYRFSTLFEFFNPSNLINFVPFFFDFICLIGRQGYHFTVKRSKLYIFERIRLFAGSLVSIKTVNR